MQKFVVLALSIGLLLGLYPHSGFAEEEVESTKKVDFLDAVLLLDASGSMLLTDPDRLRDEGVELFTQFLREGDRLGIISFSDEAQEVRPLTPFSLNQAFEIGQAIRTIQPTGEYTDVLSAVEGASSMLLDETRPGAEQVIILLSDGKMDPHPRRGSVTLLLDRLFRKVLPPLVEAEVKIHTLALSDQADLVLLERIAESTGGSSWYAAEAEQIQDNFENLFVEATSTEVSEEDISSKGFRVDGILEEITFYVNTSKGVGEIGLLTPDGVRFTQRRPGQIRWFKGSSFELMTIDKPEPGLWKVTGIPRDEGYATMLDNLKLVSRFPTVVEVGNEELLQVRLFQSRKPVALSAISEAVTFAYQLIPTDKVSEPVVRELLVDDGTLGDKVANDGIYSRTLKAPEPGEYRIESIARGPTFERRHRGVFSSKPRIVSISIVPPTESHLATMALEKHQGELLQLESEYIKVQLADSARGLKKSKVLVTATTEGEEPFAVPMEKVPGGWETPVSVLPEKVMYTLKASFFGRVSKYKTLSGESLPYTYSSSGGSGKTQITKIETKEEEKKKKKEIVREVSTSEVLLYTLLLTLINAALGGGGIWYLMRLTEASGGEELTIEPGTDLEQVRDLLAQLEKRSALIEVDLADPIFTAAELEVLLLPEVEEEPDEDYAEEEADFDEEPLEDGEENDEERDSDDESEGDEELETDEELEEIEDESEEELLEEERAS